jgi:hypothetical protein
VHGRDAVAPATAGDVQRHPVDECGNGHGFSLSVGKSVGNEERASRIRDALSKPQRGSVTPPPARC